MRSLRLADRLPEVSASCDLADGSLALQFDDNEDSLRIPRRSRDLAGRVRSLGVSAAADHLADEYLRLNAGRRSVLDAVKHAASDRGWGLQRVRPFFLATGIPATWYLGQTQREVELAWLPPRAARHRSKVVPRLSRSIRCPSQSAEPGWATPSRAATFWPTKASTLTTKTPGVNVLTQPSPGCGPTLNSVLVSAIGSWNGRERRGSGPPPNPTS